MSERRTQQEIIIATRRRAAVEPSGTRTCECCRIPQSAPEVEATIDAKVIVNVPVDTPEPDHPPE